MYYSDELLNLQKILMKEYVSYRAGDITVQEYLIRAKPLDKAIGKLEMSTLQDTLAYKVTFLQHSQRLKH